MVDISAHIDPIATAIFETYEKANSHDKARTYLGASVIGKECSRALWYDFRWTSGTKKWEGRMLRLFRTGDYEEGRMVADLRALGATVYDVDPATGKQFEFVDHGGHMKGHMDGCGQHIPTGGNKWHVLEFKTHNDKSFKDLKAKGVRASKPEHYAQMMWYMGKSGMNRALYLAKNKNDEDIHSERIEFDVVEFERIQEKAKAIIFASQPPSKISEDPKFYICNMCDHKAVCHGHRVPRVSCRTCCFSTPETDGDGRWSCARHKTDIEVKVQRVGCDNHLPLPFLVTYAEAMDAGEGWIQFKRKDNGAEFVVADAVTLPPVDAETALPVLTTHELAAAADYRAIANPEVEQIKAAFPGARIGG